MADARLKKTLAKRAPTNRAVPADSTYRNQIANWQKSAKSRIPPVRPAFGNFLGQLLVRFQGQSPGTKKVSKAGTPAYNLFASSQC
jgi:hypothetical protein